MTAVGRLVAGCVALATLLLSSDFCSAQYLTGSDRADFIKGVVNGCIGRKDADAFTASVAMPLYTSYCSCYADRLADRAQMSDLGAADPKVMNPIIAEAAKPCHDEMRQAAGAK